MKFQSLPEVGLKKREDCKTWDQMGVTVHKNSLENCNLLTKSGFSRKKVDYFDGFLLNKKNGSHQNVD